MRIDEEFAKESYSRLLSSLTPTAKPDWEDGPDPPDYFLRWRQETYAVEVTRVVSTVSINDRTFSKRTVGGTFDQFRNRVRSEAADSGILRGAYSIWMEPISLTRDSLDEALAKALAYIAGTSDQSSAEESTLLRDGHRQWSIRKHHDQKSYVAALTSDGGGGFEGEIRPRFEIALTQAVECKVSLADTTSLPTVLLLIDDYHYATARNWGDCLSDSLKAHFHTIARTFGEYECQVLCAVDGPLKTKPIE